MEAQPQAAPPVVAVLVAHDPGAWFDEVLASLAAQDYPNLSVLVIDAASQGNLAATVAAHLPSAYVRRLEADPGFGPAANEALRLVEGAGFFCFLHDDVALEPPTVRQLVEEAFRSNAGVVGPKLVEWEDPRRLLAVGMGADKAGVLVALCEPGEMDQEQHDAVRDVFMVPSACMLVRVDLFDALDGFDPAMHAYGEALDLCWRAHVVGARVMVNPGTRVRHREAEEEGVDPDDRSRLLARHRMRTVLTCYGILNLIRVLPQIAVITVATAFSSLVTGHPGRARSALGAWSWNIAHYGEIRRRSRYLDRIRLVPDNEVRNLQSRGSAQVRAALRRPAGEERFAAAAAVGRSVAGSLAPGPRRTAILAWVVALVFLVFGSRELITHGVPAIGQLAPLPSSATDLARSFTAGWRAVGLGTVAAAPTAFALIALASIPVLGQMALLHTLLTLLPLLIGLIGMWRLTAPLDGVRGRVASLVAYAAIPLPYNALSNGRWDGLVAYAVMPWVLARLARASRIPPYMTSPGSSWKSEVLGLGLIVGIAAAIVPFVVVLVAAAALCIVLASMLAGGWRGSFRAIGIALGGVVVALVLNLPWAVGVFTPRGSWSGFAAVDPAGAGSLSLGQILRFETGSLGAAPLGWAFLVVGALALVIGRGWRLGWATRAWTVAVVPFAVTWAASRGWIDVGLPSAETLLAPAAAGLALAAGLGITSFDVDLRGYRFGWRQLASLIAAGALAVGVIPALIGASGGRWRAPRSDFAASLAFMSDDPQAGAFRVLWLGQPSVLPLAGWQLGDGVAYATSDNGTPDVRYLWAGKAPESTQRLAEAVALAANGNTDRLGSLLGPMGVRYVVVPERIAPSLDDTPLVPAPAALTTALDSQLDLQQLDVDDALRVYENTSWIPVRSLSQASGPTRPALADQTGVFTFEGPLATGTLVAADTPNDRWKLTVGGSAVPRKYHDEVSSTYSIGTAGSGSLTFDTPWSRTAAVAAQGVVWLIAIVMLLRWRTANPWLPGRRRAVDRPPVPDDGIEPIEVAAELETSGAVS
ncbi:MAG TPA: glycosyltransferase [Acidimicrobiales bacterium]|nr:glycosyltransferase [Acidimicrobiales bacterium]